MTDESYSIVINDKVDSEIASKIHAIAENAIYADSAVEKLNKTLRLLSGQSSVDKLSSALLKMTSQSAKVSDQLSRLELSNSRVAISEQKLATEFQKTQAAMAGVDTALNKTIASENLAAASAQKLAVEEAKLSVETQRLVTEQQRSAQAAAQAQAAYQKSVASITEAQVASQRLVQSQAQAAAAQAGVTTAAIKQKTAVEQLAEATSRAGAAQLQGAIAAQRLATEQERTDAATARTAAASDRAAIAALRLQQAQTKAAQGTNALQREAEQLKQSLNPLYAAQVAHNNETQRALSLYKQGAISVETYTQAVNRSTDRFQAAKQGANALDTGMVKLNKSTNLNRQSLVNLGFQLQDVGVSLASGQNPLTVFIQQGAQIAGIASQAGVSLGTMAKAAAAMLLPFAPLVIALGLAYTGLKLFQSEAAKGEGLETYAKKLGYTSKQIKEFNADQITMMDTAKAFFKTVFGGEASEKLEGFMNSVKKTFKNIAGYGLEGVNLLISSFSGGIAVIQELFGRLPVGIKKPILEGFNTVLYFFEGFVNQFIKGVNIIIEGLNKISKEKIDPFSEISLPKFDTNVRESVAKDLISVYAEAVDKTKKSLEKSQGEFGKQLSKNAADEARKRIKATAEAQGIKPKKDKDSSKEESRANALAKVNAQLDNEAKRVFEIVNLRKVDAELDRIKERFIGKGQPLNDKEVAALREKIVANQKALEIQKEFDRVYQESVAPAEKYGETILAVTKLVEKGYITQDFANEQVRLAGEEFNKAIDPLYAYTKALKDQDRINGVSAKNRQLEQQVIEVENLYKAKGKTVTEEMTAAIRAEIQARNDRQRVIEQENSLQGSSIANQQQATQDKIQAMRNLSSDPSSGFGQADVNSNVSGMLGSMGIDTTNFQSQLDTQLQMYQSYSEQLAELNKEVNGKKLLSDQQYAAASLQLEIGKNNLYLNQASGFFGQLSGLQKSENKKMAAVGKAAAIAQTTIQTYQAAMGAYASLAAIPIVGPVLGAAAAAAAIVVGMQNVAQIRSQGAGFMAGGYTGGGGRAEVAGVVHGQEYVMNAAATSRIGVSNLQALQDGSATVQKGMDSPVGTAGGVNIFVTNKASDVQITARQINERDVEIIAERVVTQKSDEITANNLSNPSSKTSRSLSRNTKTVRAV